MDPLTRPFEENILIVEFAASTYSTRLIVHHALDKRVEGSPLSEEVQASLSKLRHLTDPQELADAHAELQQKAQVKDLVDSLFNDFNGAS